jgi:hypothetical protein
MKYDEKQLLELLKNPIWVNIGNLPSNFYPYNFGSLYIRPFNVQHLKLLSKAQVTKDIDLQIQAVDMVITQDVREISIGDYYYILQWLKINSTTKTPLVVEWHCPEQVLTHKETGNIVFNGKVLEQVAHTLNPEDYNIEPCNTHNTELLHITDLNIIQLPEDNWEGLPEGFDFPRVSILAEVREALKDPELNLLVPAAQWVKGDTLADKIKTLEEQDNLDMFNTAQSLTTVLDHGVNETSTLHCRHCRAEHPYKVVIDTLSFFR